jgi:transposase
MLFPENIGEYLSIDEVSLSQGELYTFITNKKGRGKKGSLVASIKGTRSADIIHVLENLTLESRKTVKEVTLDMAKNMESAVKLSFPCCKLVTDRFHVVKLVIDALQHVRIKLRWKELDIENQAIEKAKEAKLKYIPAEYSNGDTPKQLLARSRHALAKKESNWTSNQKNRIELLFVKHPELQEAYKHIMKFRNIYEGKNKLLAREQIESWIQESKEKKIKELNSAAYSIEYNLDNILNFFDNRNTNANAESFNSKIKLFRANMRGVTDVAFFLFRLKNLFA